MISSVPPHESPSIANLEDLIAGLSDTNFLSPFAGETERGAALAVAATLDHSLGDLLKSWMIDDHDVLSSMFSDMAPLGSFGSRIRLGYLLGVYGRNFYKDLTTIDRVRNAFTHSADAKDFSHPIIDALTNTLDTIERFDQVVTDDGSKADMSRIFDTFGLDVQCANWRFVCSSWILHACITATTQSGKYQSIPDI
jgi:DNA-binding MltR family transcriptional regulator